MWVDPPHRSPAGPADHAEVWLIRHAQSEANAAGVWQGQTESDVTEHGRGQIDALARWAASVHREWGKGFDLVVSSPLRRARETAAALGVAEFDHDLIEIDLGRWEGKTWQEVAASNPAQLQALGRGEDVRFGERGESLRQLTRRVESALARLFSRLPAGGRAAVVTHGGVLDVLVEQAFGRRDGRRVGGFPENASISRLRRRLGRRRLVSFNDVSHLGRRPRLVEEALAAHRAVLAVIRHARTAANVEGRWQGQTDGGLDEVGRSQAGALARRYPGFDRVFSSPLGRAWETAGHLHPAPVACPGLAELSFGRWEGLTVAEIRRGWPDLFDEVFVNLRDVARGETGETWAQLMERVQAAFSGLTVEPGRVTGVVTHGAAIRAYLGSLAGFGWDRSHVFDTPANASVTHVVLDPKGPTVADFGNVGHLERSMDDPSSSPGTR